MTFARFPDFHSISSKFIPILKLLFLRVNCTLHNIAIFRFAKHPSYLDYLSIFFLDNPVTESFLTLINEEKKMGKNKIKIKK